MAAFFRFLSRRFKRKKNVPTHSHTEEVIPSKSKVKQKKSDLECRVTYLDGTEQTFYLPKKALASELYDIAFAYVGLNDEKDYFGLLYTGKNPEWLDPTKQLRKQCSGTFYPFSLKVKFFASHPHNLRDEYVRYLMVLQLRESIQTGQLPCTDLRLAVELAALLLQAEFGDYDPKQHTPVFVSTFRFITEAEQTEEFELAVIAQYKSMRNRNMTPAMAESLYLERVSHLPDYGVSMYHVKGKDNAEYRLGLTPTGILVYEGDNKIGLFVWPMILKLEMNGCRLKVKVAEEDEKTRAVIEHSFCFTLANKTACKSLWKRSVEYHAFFRLTSGVQGPPKTRGFLRLGSRFHATFHTEHQLSNLNPFGSSSFRKRKAGASASMRSPPTQPGPSAGAPPKSSSFRRVPSRRFASRPSFAHRGNLEGRRARLDRHLENRSSEQAQECTTVSVERTPKNNDWSLRGRCPPPSHAAIPKSAPTLEPAERITPRLGSQRQAAPQFPQVPTHKIGSSPKQPVRNHHGQNASGLVEYTF